MKTLDDMLNASMADMAVRNNAVFESTRHNVLSVMGGGGLPWTWISSIGVLVVAGATWYALQSSTVDTVVVQPISTPIEHFAPKQSLQHVSETVAIAPTTKQNIETQSTTQELNAHVESVEAELVQLFDVETQKAEAAARLGKHLQAKKIYSDLARTMRLHGDEQRARSAEANALSVDK